ncbi:MAG: translocation/assembly module TamB, partial [Coleofasciculaceae cyanobacterium SM2_3_26]|nr:translocation/assembly module TamB [Coleofasciculaceae cyanobacterium SM2_3_26]
GQTQQEPLVIPEFQGLQITLGRNFRIASPPVLNFVADGGFVLNGTLDDLRPDGTVRLRRGEVNIFTTRFDLQRGYAHRAVFRPEFGLDPVLDLRLATSVQQVTRPTDLQSGSAEIAEASITNLGEVDTVRVEAIVDGRASELLAEQSDALELRSSPPRTESEIVALLGGWLYRYPGRERIGAIANIAGSAILSRFDTSIGDALGLDEFRLFPTTTNNEGEFELGLGAEAGIDITRNVTFSILKILTSEDPAQFNLRYRLSDRVTIRGTTDFAGENRAVILYEVRF